MFFLSQKNTGSYVLENKTKMKENKYEEDAQS